MPDAIDPWLAAEADLLNRYPLGTTEGRVLRILIGYRTEYELLQRELATPPAGWFNFGHHIDQPGIQLEFWGDQGGIPLWERPAGTDPDAQLAAARAALDERATLVAPVNDMPFVRDARTALGMTP